MTALLEVSRIGKSFGAIHAVREVSFTVGPGEIVGLVGESGSGKSTVANLVLGLERPDRGEIRYAGKPLPVWMATRSGRDYRAAVQAVFQDPVQAMDSRKTIGWSVAEPMVIHRSARGEALQQRVAELMASVHLDPALAQRLPHQVSGGQAQRANIARALALNPALLVCDEAVSALDVSVQAQILNLFLDIQQRLGTAMLFISHALPVVRHLADRIVVMYAGAVVEEGPAEMVCDRPRHPYTQLLISSSPSPSPAVPFVRSWLASPQPALPLPGQSGLVSLAPGRATRGQAARGPAGARREGLPMAGCRFAPRCALADEQCRVEEPVLREIAPGQRAACWHSGDFLPSQWQPAAHLRAEGN